jgi:hypothetical protein
MDETFQIILSDTTIFIKFHSIHFLPFYDYIPQQSLKPTSLPNTKIQNPVEVNDIDKLDSKISVYVYGLNFDFPPSEFLEYLYQFGEVLFYCQSKGQLVAQFKETSSVFKAIAVRDIEWKSRSSKIIRLPRQFSWKE